MRLFSFLFVNAERCSIRIQLEFEFIAFKGYRTLAESLFLEFEGDAVQRGNLFFEEVGRSLNHFLGFFIAEAMIRMDDGFPDPKIEDLPGFVYFKDDRIGKSVFLRSK